MYQREGDIFDCFFYEQQSGCWSVDGIPLDRQTIMDVYQQFCGPNGKITSVEEIWTTYNSSGLWYKAAKRAIFAMAVKQPGIHPMIAAIYLLALKHNCLHMFQGVENLDEYSFDNLIPYDVRFIFLDVKRLCDFYNKYGTHSHLSKKFNKIKFPDNFNKP